MFGFGACRSCNGGDPTTDTVKVNFSPAKANPDKENFTPNSPSAEDKEWKLKQEADEERARQEAVEQMRREREEQERLALQRQQEEALARQRQQEAEERQKALEEEARRQEEVRRQEAAERAQKQQELDQWLAKGGFAGVNEKKKKSGLMSSGFTYPLHAAAKADDAAAIALLLWGGADKSLQDSSKLTALAVAQKLGKKGSHKEVIAALEA